MSEGIVTRIAGTLSLLVLFFMKGYSQDVSVPPVRFMFYNVENLFDTFNDSITEDDEFLPDGLRRWNYRRYSAKIQSIYKTIIAAGEWEPPALIALCEIENRKVLEDLVYGTGLSRYDYGIIHEDSKDPRGIDVCLIYRKDKMVISNFRYLIPDDINSGEFLTRSVLYAECLLPDDTIHLLVNHWPSRRGGVLAGEELRRKIAGLVKNTVDSISSISAISKGIIILGDLNCTPDDNVAALLTGNYRSGIKMVNLSSSVLPGIGTYRYLGTWEMIDQVIISGKLADGYAEFRIFQPDFLLKYDRKYPGPSPFSTFSGYRYQGGFSDHLPVLLDIKLR
jgi:hypothetical protein